MPAKQAKYAKLRRLAANPFVIRFEPGRTAVTRFGTEPRRARIEELGRPNQVQFQRRMQVQELGVTSGRIPTRRSAENRKIRVRLQPGLCSVSMLIP